MNITNPKTRRYLYRVGVAALTVLYVKGIVTEQDVVSIEPLLAALLGLADRNVNVETAE